MFCVKDSGSVRGIANGETQFSISKAGDVSVLNKNSTALSLRKDLSIASLINKVGSGDVCLKKEAEGLGFYWNSEKLTGIKASAAAATGEKNVEGKKSS